MKKTSFEIGEFYHVYNRGVDKRSIVSDSYDVERFLQSMREFNSQLPIGSIYENRFKQKDVFKVDPLVTIIAYCLNPNHFHFLITPKINDGIQKFMQRIGNGYTKYFNTKYERSGFLFEGPYKGVHIISNEQLVYVSAYINLNARVHSLGHPMSKLSVSSWEEYIGHASNPIVDSSIILEQFKNSLEYKHCAEETVEMIVQKRKADVLEYEFEGNYAEKL